MENLILSILIKGQIWHCNNSLRQLNESEWSQLKHLAVNGYKTSWNTWSMGGDPSPFLEYKTLPALLIHTLSLLAANTLYHQSLHSVTNTGHGILTCWTKLFIVEKQHLYNSMHSKAIRSNVHMWCVQKVSNLIFSCVNQWSVGGSLRWRCGGDIHAQSRIFSHPQKASVAGSRPMSEDV
jgi:hypothetical protein